MDQKRSVSIEKRLFLGLQRNRRKSGPNRQMGQERLVSIENDWSELIKNGGTELKFCQIRSNWMKSVVKIDGQN